MSIVVDRLRIIISEMIDNKIIILPEGKSVMDLVNSFIETAQDLDMKGKLPKPVSRLGAE